MIKALLIDLDGTLYIADKAIPGTAEAISQLRSQNYSLRFVTNTTTSPTAVIHKKLISLGFEVHQDEILTPVGIAGKMMASRGFTTWYPAVEEAVKGEFKNFRATEHAPDCVVMGDLSTHWDYVLLQKIFELVMEEQN